jgi:hypothetical protein
MLCLLPSLNPVPSLYPLLSAFLSGLPVLPFDSLTGILSAPRDHTSGLHLRPFLAHPGKNWSQVMHPTTEYPFISTVVAIFPLYAIPILGAEKSL